MPHERIYADTADPTWHEPHPTDPMPGGDDIPVRDVRPGIHVQWHGDGDLPTAVGIGTGDLTLMHDGEHLPEVDLTDFLPVPEDHDEGRDGPLYANIRQAIERAIRAAYELGVATPRVVWIDRQQIQHLIRTGKRARNAAYGADE